MDRIADIEALEADIDLFGDLRRIADKLEVVADQVKHAATLDAGRQFLVGEVDRHVNVHLAMLTDTEKVDVDRAARHRVKLHVLGQRAVRGAAVVDHDHGVHEVTGRKHLGKKLFLDVDREGFLLVAIDNGGDPASAAQFTGGSLASPFALLGGQRQLFAHVVFLAFVWCPPRLLQGWCSVGIQALANGLRKGKKLRVYSIRSTL